MSVGVMGGVGCSACLLAARGQPCCLGVSRPSRPSFATSGWWVLVVVGWACTFGYAWWLGASMSCRLCLGWGLGVSNLHMHTAHIPGDPSEGRGLRFGFRLCRG